VLVPACTRMPLDTFARLLALADAGGTCCSSRPCRRRPGWGRHAERLAQFSALRTRAALNDPAGRAGWPWAMPRDSSRRHPSAREPGRASGPDVRGAGVSRAADTTSLPIGANKRWTAGCRSPTAPVRSECWTRRPENGEWGEHAPGGNGGWEWSCNWPRAARSCCVH